MSTYTEEGVSFNQETTLCGNSIIKKAVFLNTVIM